MRSDFGRRKRGQMAQPHIAQQSAAPVAIRQRSLPLPHQFGKGRQIRYLDRRRMAHVWRIGNGEQQRHMAYRSGS